MEIVRVQVIFNEPTKYGEYRDALYFTPYEYQTISLQQIKSMKDERIVAYEHAIEHTPAIPKPSKEELQIAKDELLRQLDDINLKLLEK